MCIFVYIWLEWGRLRQTAPLLPHMTGLDGGILWIHDCHADGKVSNCWERISQIIQQSRICDLQDLDPLAKERSKHSIFKSSWYAKQVLESLIYKGDSWIPNGTRLHWCIITQRSTCTSRRTSSFLIRNWSATWSPSNRWTSAHSICIHVLIFKRSSSCVLQFV